MHQQFDSTKYPPTNVPNTYPASNRTIMTNPTNAEKRSDAPPPSMSDNIMPPATPASITRMINTGTTSPTLTTEETTSDYPPPATYNITLIPAMGTLSNLPSFPSHIHLTHRPGQ
ncbi:unnamed protein product [Schistocephalus solidus]|uniref:Uncharacterized protein n=1 Tax=Schistocephalus solidus TaxID=70667 RepID=A0A183T781_SCHSO|nr:unnamed protein product [Schistocephalus solidus]